LAEVTRRNSSRGGIAGVEGAEPPAAGGSWENPRNLRFLGRG